MELFQKAKVVRLKSHHDKYLLAEDDEESVYQDRNGSVKNAKWTVEFVDNPPGLRFKSCFGKYLTASNLPFLLGMTGKKVLQTLPQKPDPSTEWEALREGFLVRLKTRNGQFLRANSGLPPWRDSVTHDTPFRTATKDWILWDIDILQSSESVDGSPMTAAEGRVIHYLVANRKGEVKKGEEEVSFTFKGSQPEELKEKLIEESGLPDIIVCTRNPLNGKLYPLRLHLPPNNAGLHVVLVPSSNDIETLESP